MKAIATLLMAGMLAWNTSADGAELPARVREFAGEKEALVKAKADKWHAAVMSGVLDYFAAARKGDALDAMSQFKELSELLAAESNDEAQAKLDAFTRQAMLDVQLVLEAMVEGEPKHALAFGETIVKSLPKGSIYFGGTDPGRAMPSLLAKKLDGSEPVFVVTQSALLSQNYREYLRTMHGDSIKLPSKKDQDAAFSDYIKDAERRAKHDQDFLNEPKQLLPGETVTINKGRVSVSGAVAVTQINGNLVKQMFEENADRDFFIEENHPIAWMTPHLSPHGLILKVNRKALASLSPEVVAKDRSFWIEQQRELIGDWLKPEPSLKEVCGFVEKVFVKRELTSFRGDAKFTENENVGKMYSQPRGAIGGVYEWRATQAKEKSERERMLKEADFAYRQAFALCPSNAGVVMRYASFLTANSRRADAALVAETASNVDPGNSQLAKLKEELASAAQ